MRHPDQPPDMATAESNLIIIMRMCVRACVRVCVCEADYLCQSTLTVLPAGKYSRETI